MKWRDVIHVLLVCAALSGAHYLGERQGFAEARRTMATFVDGYAQAACSRIAEERGRTGISDQVPGRKY